MRSVIVALCTALLVAACGGGTVSGVLDGTSSSSSSSSSSGSSTSSSSSSSSGGGTASYTISASVGGLAGSGLVLQYNGGNNLAVAANGTFTFTNKIAAGASYLVTVLSQPTSPAQACTVSAATGTATANVTVTVACVTQYTISATVTGLSGSGLILQNNGGNDLAVAANGTYAFTTPIAAGGAYAVTVLTPPSSPAQVCTVTAGSGTASSNVNVAVSCALTQYTVSANVSGVTGSGLVLQDNGGDNLMVASNGTYAFAMTIPYGGAYAVTVLTQPSNPAQICTVTAGSGTLSANVTVAVSCVAQYTISASVSGLAGTGLVLRDNGGNNLAVSSNGTHAFSTLISAGGAYAVTVYTQPSNPTQLCSVTAGSGTANANVTVAVACTTQYTISADVTGLHGSGLVLQNNGGNNLAVSASGTHPFTVTIASGSAYAVTVLTQPTSPAQYCRVSNGTGTASANETANVVCSTVGKYVFVASPLDTSTGSVAAFTIAPTTGVLTPVAAPYTPVNGELAPAALAVDTANGSYLYVADSGSADVSTWGIGAGGVLTQDAVGGSPASMGDSTNVPYSLAFDSAGFLYVGSYDSANAMGPPPQGGQIEGFSVSNGALTALSSSPYLTPNPQHSLAIDPTNQLLYAPDFGDGSIWEFDIVGDGSLSRFGYNSAPLLSPYAVAIDPTALFLYATDNGFNGGPSANTVEEYAYDGTTLTSENSYPVGSQPQAIAIDPTGSFLYVSNSGDGTVSAFTISSGALAAVAGSPFTASGTASTNVPTALAIDPSGQYLYVANGDAGTISVFKITAGSGVLVKAEPDVPCISSSGGPAAIVIQ